MTATQLEADTYAIGLPDSWISIPTEPGAYLAFGDELISKLAEAGADAAARRGTEMLLRDVIKQMDEARVVQAAIGVTSLEATDGDGVLSCSVTVSTGSREDIGAPSPVTVAALLRAVSRSDGGDAALSLEPPSRVRLPVGSAVRLRRHHEPGGRGTRNGTYVETYLVPHDAGERLLTVQFATPNTTLIASFQSLFEKIVQTVRIFRPGDPTSWDDGEAGRAVQADESSDDEGTGDGE